MARTWDTPRLAEESGRKTSHASSVKAVRWRERLFCCDVFGMAGGVVGDMEVAGVWVDGVERVLLLLLL